MNTDDKGEPEFRGQGQMMFVVRIKLDDIRHDIDNAAEEGTEENSKITDLLHRDCVRGDFIRIAVNLYTGSTRMLRPGESEPAAPPVGGAL